MSDPYERVKGGRLAFKGGDLATRKSIEKKNKKKKKQKEKLDAEKIDPAATSSATTVDVKEADIYTIDAAQKKKYDELFPVEAKKFSYVPKSNLESVAQALDDRVKKKADRYCK